jgi:hypothetical protein
MLVGLCGEGGVGKDSVAAVFKQELGFVQKACADGVRQEAWDGNAYLPEVQCTYREILERLGYERAKREHPCVREHLISIGHGQRLKHGEDYWLKKVTSSAQECVVLSDVRYLNEAEYCHKNGFLLRIRRPGFEGVHETERKSLAEIPDELFNRVIINDCTLEELQEKVRKWISDCWLMLLWAPRPESTAGAITYIGPCDACLRGSDAANCPHVLKPLATCFVTAKQVGRYVEIYRDLRVLRHLPALYKLGTLLKHRVSRVLISATVAASFLGEP